MPHWEASALGRLGQLAGIVLLLVGLGLGAWGAPYYMLDWGSAVAISGAVFAVGGLLSLLLGSALLRLDGLRRSIESLGEARGREPALDGAAPFVFPSRPTPREVPHPEPTPDPEPRGPSLAGVAIGAAAGGLALSGRAILGSVAQPDEPGRPLTASREDSGALLNATDPAFEGANADSSMDLLARLDREFASAPWPDMEAERSDAAPEPSHEAAAEHGEAADADDGPGLKAGADEAPERPSTDFQPLRPASGHSEADWEDVSEAQVEGEVETLLTSTDRASLDDLLARLDQAAPLPQSVVEREEPGLPPPSIRDALYARIDAATHDLGAVRETVPVAAVSDRVERDAAADADWRRIEDDGPADSGEPPEAERPYRVGRPDLDGPASDQNFDEAIAPEVGEASPEREPAPIPSVSEIAEDETEEAAAGPAELPSDEFDEPPAPPAQPTASDEGVVAAYTVGDSAYAMLADGRIRVTTPEGMHLFQSMEELKAFMAARRAGQSA
jgi:hypothetical protein